MLRALEDLARRVGLEVRVEESWKGGPAAGGICRLRGKPLVLLDALAPVPAQVEVLCEILCGFDLDDFFLPPALRARIQQYAADVPTARRSGTR